MALSRRARASSVSEPVVLIGFAEALAAIESAWSLQAAGFRVVAFRRSTSRPALRRVRGIEIHEVPRPEDDANGAVEAVLELCERLTPAALLPLDDFALWVCGRLPDVGATLAGASGHALDCALDKGLQIAAAVQASLPVPPTQTLQSLGGAGPPEFPVMVKPAHALYEIAGTLRRPTGVVCANDQEFRRAAARPWPGPVLVQPLIRGVGEGLFGHVGTRGVTGWSAHQRVRMVNPQGSASSACRSVPVDKELLEPSERFLAAIGWQGMFMLEFLRDPEGRPWLMELNGRAWGSMALARRRGFEYPAWTVRARIDADFEPVLSAEPPDILCRNLGLELAHLAFVARGPQSVATMEWPRLSRAIRDVCTFTKHDRLYNWDRSQPDVLMADLAGTIRQYARQMVTHKQ
jgi:hypothetical protein